MLTFMAGRKAFQGFEGMAGAQRRRLGDEVGTGGAGAGAGGVGWGGTSGNFRQLQVRHTSCSNVLALIVPSSLFIGVNRNHRHEAWIQFICFSLSRTHTLTEAYRYLQLCVCDGYSLHLEKKKKKLRGRPVSRELHLRFSLLRTVIMHKTSKNRGFIFAFNYFLAQGSTCVRLCVCESMSAGPAECTDRVLPPSLARRNTTKPQGRFCYV